MTAPDGSEPRRDKRGRRIVAALWLLVAGWLVVAIAVSVFSAVFLGDGPLKRSPRTRTPVTQTQLPPAPAPPAAPAPAPSP